MSIAQPIDSWALNLLAKRPSKAFWCTVRHCINDEEQGADYVLRNSFD